MPTIEKRPRGLRNVLGIAFARLVGGFGEKRVMPFDSESPPTPDYLKICGAAEFEFKNIGGQWSYRSRSTTHFIPFETTGMHTIEEAARFVCKEKSLPLPAK
jgi:hypothetical protein